MLYNLSSEPISFYGPEIDNVSYAKIKNMHLY